MDQFIRMSKYAGMREDLVQAGGGNSSVKTEKSKMFIKASGCQLADISYETGYSAVNQQIIIEFFNISKEKITKDLESKLLEQCFIEGEKPSIETFLHSITDRYTLHTHPMLVNVLTSRKNGMSILQRLFPQALIVDYATPGIMLAKLYYTTYINNRTNKNQIYDIIFLKNHGVLVSGKSGDKVIEKTEYVNDTLSKYLGFNIDCYKNVTKLFNALGDENDIIYLSDNKSILDAIHEFGSVVWNFTFCPDCIVYCGKSILSLCHNFSKEDIEKFVGRFGKPVAILLDKRIYIAASSMKKAKEIESVLSFSAQVAKLNREFEMDLLSDEEQNYLLNWDAEKYRQNMK